MGVKRLGPKKFEITAELGINPVTGKRVQKREVFNGSESEANRRYGEILATIGAVDHLAGTMTLRTYLETIWLPKRKAELSVNGYAHYRRAAETHIVPLLGSVRMKSLTPGMIDHAISQVPTSASRVHVYKTLSVALGHAYRKHRILAENPMVFVEAPRHTPKPKERHSVEQVRELLTIIAGSRVEPGVLVMLFAGLRKEEALGADLPDFTFKGARVGVNVVRAYTATDGRAHLKETKTYQTRFVPIDPTLAAMIRRSLGNRATGPLVIGPDGSRMHPDAFRDEYRALIDAHNDNLGEGAMPFPYLPVNQMRHTFASLHADSGTSMPALAELLGQSRIATTMRYTAPTQTAGEEAASRLAGVVLESSRILTEPHEKRA